MNWLNARAICCISIRHTHSIDSPARHTQVHVHGESVNHRFNEGRKREMLKRGGVEEKEEGVTWFTMRSVTLRNWMTSEMYAPPCYTDTFVARVCFPVCSEAKQHPWEQNVLVFFLTSFIGFFSLIWQCFSWEKNTQSIQYIYIIDYCMLSYKLISKCNLYYLWD